MRRVLAVLFEYTHTLCVSQIPSSRFTSFRTTHVVFLAVINRRVQTHQRNISHVTGCTHASSLTVTENQGGGRDGRQEYERRACGCHTHQYTRRKVCPARRLRHRQCTEQGKGFQVLRNDTAATEQDTCEIRWEEWGAGVKQLAVEQCIPKVVGVHPPPFSCFQGGGQEEGWLRKGFN